jgi:hypothetical protein
MPILSPMPSMPSLLVSSYFDKITQSTSIISSVVEVLFEDSSNCSPVES